MKKKFNITGCCYPDRHYMVDISDKLEEIKELVDDGEYFIINRARQYGKTTTLNMLKIYLENDYIVLALDFQDWGVADFQEEERFASSFADCILRLVRNKKNNIQGLNAYVLEKLELISKKELPDIGLRVLFQSLNELCDTAPKQVVLMIDEADSALNNMVFLDFLGKLRSAYLHRDSRATFQSVIFASVYDIKNLKLKIRPDEEHQYNSPWNIAADFTIDLCFTVSDIGQMLSEYEKDNHCGMDINKIAQAIYDYTSGYPYLVSKICKLIDEKQGESIEAGTFEWTTEGVRVAVKSILGETNTLFDDMRKKLDDYPKLREMIYDLLFQGFKMPFNRYNESINIGVTFGFISENDGVAVISNRIFETYFYNLFISEEALNSDMYKAGSMAKNQFIHNGSLDMDLVMRKFSEYYHEIYRDSDERFVEENGRRLFLLYLKPIINGVGNYYIEARTRDATRTDIIVDYLGERFVIELKIWRGKVYHENGEKQLAGYLEAYHQNRGYLLSFDFNKNKKTGINEIQIGDKSILEVIV